MSTRRESAIVAPPNIARTRLIVGSTNTTLSVRGRAMTDMWMSSTGLVMSPWLQTQAPRPGPSVEVFEHVRLDGIAFALERHRAQAAHPRAGQRAQRSRSDRDRSDRRRALQACGHVHGVADDRVALALARAYDADHRDAAVDADAEARPVGMRRLGRLGRAQPLERGARGALGVVGLVAARVERRDDGVPDEPVDLAAMCPDRGDRALERGVQHRRDLP